MLIDKRLYRKAFQAFLRKGTPIEWTIKQERATSHYVWRTREDGKVRPSHAANDGHVFAWDDPPPTGNPGEDYGCRCVAEPYYPGATEHVTTSLSDVADSGPAWSSWDFVKHYYEGNGAGVTVRETGHLEDIVAKYMEIAGRNLQNQIAAKSRQNRDGSFDYDFENTYNMTFAVFSIGDTTIGGTYSGSATEVGGMLTISGGIRFYLRVKFVDPLDVGLEAIDPGETINENILRPLEDIGRESLGLPPNGRQCLGIHMGEPYPIADVWVGIVEGQVYLDPLKSAYV